MKLTYRISLICSLVLALTAFAVPASAENATIELVQNEESSQSIVESTKVIGEDVGSDVNEYPANDKAVSTSIQSLPNSEQEILESASTQNEPDVVVVAGKSKVITVSPYVCSAKSLNTDIAIVSHDSNSRSVTIKGIYVGTAEVVLTDENNHESTLLVVVEAPPFELSTNAVTISGSYNNYFYWNYREEYDDGYVFEPRYWLHSYYDEYYDDDEEYDEDYDVYDDEDYEDSGIEGGMDIRPTTKTIIKRVRSSNTSVVCIVPDSYHVRQWEDEEGYYSDSDLGGCFDIYPTGAGTATITCTGRYGETATLKVTVTKGFISSLIKKKSTQTNIRYGKQTITGKAPAGTKVTVKIGKKKRTAKANAKGKYTINKLPVYKIGAKVYYTFSYRGGTHSVTKKIIKTNTKIGLSRVYRKTKTVKVTLRNVSKGDTFQLKIGKKTYKKKISKNASKYTFKVKVKKKKKAGIKVKATIKNKFKQTLATKSNRVYYASDVKKGMKKSQCKLVPGWEYPDEVYVSGKWTTWWYDDDDDGYADDSYLEFYKGKLIGWHY